MAVALGGRDVIDTFLALLVVTVVLAVHGVIKLLLMPFRLLRGLFRYRSKPAPLTAR